MATKRKVEDEEIRFITEIPTGRSSALWFRRLAA